MSKRHMTATAKTSTALAGTKGDFVKSKCAYVKHKSPSSLHRRRVPSYDSNSQPSTDDEDDVNENYRTGHVSNRHTVIRADSGCSVHRNKELCRRWRVCSNSSSHALSSKTGNTERKLSAKDKKPYVDNRAYRHGKVAVNREFEHSNESSDPEFSEQRLKLGERRNGRPESHFSSSGESRSRSCRRGSSRRHMKPEKYNGQTSFETFFVQFNNCSKYNR